MFTYEISDLVIYFYQNGSTDPFQEQAHDPRTQTIDDVFIDEQHAIDTAEYLLPILEQSYVQSQSAINIDALQQELAAAENRLWEILRREMIDAEVDGSGAGSQVQAFGMSAMSLDSGGSVSASGGSDEKAVLIEKIRKLRGDKNGRE